MKEIKINDAFSNDIFKCSICGELFRGFGNNPYPVTTGEDDRCCDLCNYTQVMPARMKAAERGKQE